MHMQRPEVNLECCPQLLSTLVFETVRLSLTVELADSDKLTGQRTPGPLASLASTGALGQLLCLASYIRTYMGPLGPSVKCWCDYFGVCGHVGLCGFPLACSKGGSCQRPHDLYNMYHI